MWRAQWDLSLCFVLKSAMEGPILRTSFVSHIELSTKNTRIRRVHFVEGPVGLEPTTRGLKGRCSNLLSYGPVASLHKGNLMFPLSRRAPK